MDRVSQETDILMRELSGSAEETRRIAADFAADLERGSVLALHGDLGSGKTCFVQGIALGLGVEEVVNSPTYLILHEYRGRIDLNHMDLYRMRDLSEVLAFGFEEYLEAEAVLAIEWPELALELLPAQTFHIHLDCGERENERSIVVRRGLKYADAGH